MLLTIDIAYTFPAGPTVAVSLAVPSGVTAVVGPSGGGKTTLLRCVAGLTTPTTGTVRLGDTTWFDSGRVNLSPQRRRVGMLFQDYALFPHLTAAGNIGYALPRQHAARVADLLAAFDLGGLADRYPHQLSGGQKQRVALARAVAADPDVFLLDEPFAALDGPTRDRLMPDLRRRLVATGRPCLVVTHDRYEAVSLADRVAVLLDGKVVQHGSVNEVFARPASAAVAALVGVETVRAGQVIGESDGLAIVAVGSATLIATAVGEAPDVLVCIRGENVTLVPADAGPTSARNRLPGVVTSVEPAGPLVRVTVDVGFPLVALVTRPAVEELGLAVGTSVGAAVKAPSVHLIPR